MRVSNSGAGVRTPHSARASRKFQVTRDKHQEVSLRSKPSTCYLELVICYFRLGLAHLPHAFTGKLSFPDWLSRACDGALRDCDALPQRNCGRFARPSLLTRMKRTSCSQVTRGKDQVPRNQPYRSSHSWYLSLVTSHLRAARRTPRAPAHARKRNLHHYASTNANA